MARTQTTGPHRNGNGAPKEESAAAASDGGLVYVSDEQPGLRRMRSGKGFRYVDPEGRAVRDARRLELELRHALVEHSAPAPLTARPQAAGHTEWYRGAYAALEQAVEGLRERGHTVHAPLRPWLEAQMQSPAPSLFPWGSSVLERVEGEPDHLDRLPMLHALRQQVLDVIDAHRALGVDVAQHLPVTLEQWYARRGG